MNKQQGTVIIIDRAAKLDFLLRDRNAMEIGDFKSKAEFARTIGENENTLKDYWSLDRRKKSDLNDNTNNAIANLFGFSPDHEIWRRKTIEEFKLFWADHSLSVLSERRQAVQTVPSTSSGAFSGAVNENKRLLVRALNLKKLDLDLTFGEVVAARCAVTLVERTDGVKAKSSLVVVEGPKASMGPFANVLLSKGSIHFGTDLFTLNAYLALGEFLDTGVHIRKCRLVIGVDRPAEPGQLKNRRRYPDSPRLHIEPVELADTYGLRIAPDDVAPGCPSWALSLSNGPIHAFVLTNLIEVLSVEPGVVISIDLKVSLRQLATCERDC